ncbi:MAG: UDP-N-acetylmuramoyl-L-alanine--D-glutamate ligase [Candidatus Omnitrophota bacterium]
MLNDLTGKKVTVIGLGRSGMALVRLITHLRGKVRISEQGAIEGLPRDFGRELKEQNIETEFGGHTQAFIEKSDMIVLSPGVRIDAPPVQWARSKGIPVIGEIELAFRLCAVPIIAVTGSNGKTTVVNLIKEILAKAGRKVCLCGNIGSPFSKHVLELKGIDYVVLEISSFQLETIVQFRPHIAVFLNFSQNHLDRHKDMQEYLDAKKRIFANQNEHDYAVLNAGDPAVKGLAREIRSKVCYFNIPEEISKSAEKSLNPNFLAVLEVGRILGIDLDLCREVLRDFKGVEHRLEWVRTIEGIDFINDSKSTTVEAGRWAMTTIPKPILLICGGRDKNLDFSVLRSLVQEKVKKLFLIGEAKEKIKSAFGDIVPVAECSQLAEAVKNARQEALPGDCIVLSPMCASFDMFANFEERGKIFKQIVQSL